MSKPKYEIFETDTGDWRFRLVAANGEVVGPSSESYRDRTDAERGAADHQKAAIDAVIEIG